jgi:glycosyltransferase involved in cell wall biosynthesis
MNNVCWVRMGSVTPMGQQIHEAQLRGALEIELGGSWEIADRALVSLRAPHSAGRRLPLRLVWAAPYPLAAAIGSLAYGGADLVHRFDLRCPPSTRREIVTIHDVAPLRFDDEGSLPGWAATSARRAAAVICGSEFAAEEVRSLLGAQRIHVIPSGVDPRWATAAPFSEAKLADLGFGGPLVVHAGGASTRKNLAALATGWPEVVAECPTAMLVLIGPPDPRRDALFADVPNARYLGYADKTFVTRLVRSAAVVVVPSTYEGFGLPALEAMAADVAVVAAAAGPLPEVCGDAALLVEPTPAGLARGIVETLAGGAAVEQRRALGRERSLACSWERAARSTAALYEEVIA